MTSLSIAKMIIDLSVKGAMLCGGAAVLTLLMRRSPAYVRKAVWVGLLGCLILLPFAALIVPAWDLPLLPALGGETYMKGDIPLRESGAPPSTGGALTAGPPSGEWTGPGTREALANIGIGWLALVWLTGVAAYMVWFVVSRSLLKRLVAGAVLLDASWGSLLSELSHDLGTGRGVRLLKSSAVNAAITAGVFRPVIILPEGAERWSQERRRLVLSHELAHVKRWDSLIEILGFAATALHWFNPLAWLALSRLRVERERDCDNAVLNSGAKPSAYAALLMEIATDMQRRNRPMWQLATISEGSHLKDRLLCILDPKVDRRCGGRASMFAIGVLVVAFTIPVSCTHLWKKAAADIGGGQSQEEVAKEKAKKAEQAEAKQAADEKASSEDQKKKEAMKKAEYEKSMKEKPMNLRAKMESSLTDDKTRGTSAARAIGLSAYDSGPDAATKMYRKLASAGGGYYFDEKEFNRAGYMLLSADKNKEAAAIFAMNVEMYPDSWNVYDSLGEAYLAMGDFDRATELYRKSLDLNPENENGKKMLMAIEKKRAL